MTPMESGSQELTQLAFLCAAHVHMCRVDRQMWTSAGHEVLQPARRRESLPDPNRNRHFCCRT